MTQITGKHLELAVVDRLRLMIEEPPHGCFNVTQSFSLCASILCWVTQRVRAKRPRDHSPLDWAQTLHAEWEKADAKETPWGRLVFGPRRLIRTSGLAVALPSPRNFESHTVARFLKNLRDACAHGDHRIVKPFNRSGKLIGFTFDCAEKERGRKDQVWTGEVTLTESDLRAIGAWIAKTYCDALRASNEDRDALHFDVEANEIHELNIA